MSYRKEILVNRQVQSESGNYTATTQTKADFRPMAPSLSHGHYARVRDGQRLKIQPTLKSRKLTSEITPPERSNTIT